MKLEERLMELGGLARREPVPRVDVGDHVMRRLVALNERPSLMPWALVASLALALAVPLAIALPIALKALNDPLVAFFVDASRGLQ